jgi:hypothetical protein
MTTERDGIDERPRRPDVARSGPIRNLTGVFGAGGAGGSARPHSAPGDGLRGLAPDEAVARAVRAGFEVAEQAVRRGLGGARQVFGAERPEPGDAGGDGAEWTGWTAGPYVDAVASAATRWIDAWASLVQQAITVAGAAARSAVPTRSAETAPSPSPSPGVRATARLVVEVRSRRAASVQLDLSAPPSGDGALATHGLHAPPALGAPPLTEVAIAVDPDGRLRVRVDVPDTQPAGAYVGAVVGSGGDAVGTLAVRLAE